MRQIQISPADLASRILPLLPAGWHARPQPFHARDALTSNGRAGGGNGIGFVRMRRPSARRRTENEKEAKS